MSKFRLNLNDREWGEFYIRDIFTTQKNGKQIPTGAYVEKHFLKSGNTPRITVTAQNNGIDNFWHTNHKNYRTSANFISISFLGDVFYHQYTASLDMKVHSLSLKNKELNKLLALFITTQIKQNSKNSCYGNQLSSTDLPSKKILLPITPNGEPDYVFMEQFIKERMVEKLKQYNDYLDKQLAEHNFSGSLKEKQYGYFSISQLFNVTIGKTIDGNKIDKNSGQFAYITRKETNNGLDGFITEDINLLYKQYPTITIGNETAKPYVQIFPFFTGTKVNILYPKTTMSKLSLFFIARSLEMHKEKYSYSFTINSTRLKKQTIKLPITKNGDPDYAFMENYIRNLMLKKYQKYAKLRLQEYIR